MKMEKPDKTKCILCGDLFVGYGNNPAPVKDEGHCCDRCNWQVVIPKRYLDRTGRVFSEDF